MDMRDLLRNRRAIVASISGAVAAAIVGMRHDDTVHEADARNRGHRDLSAEGPCSEDPKKNKCKRNGDCCTEYCDKAINRCRYKTIGESCSSDVQCRGTATCVADVCTAAGTATPLPTATPDGCVAPGAGTLQTAIDEATAGDTICLRAGTYTGSSGNYIAVITKDLTIVGASEATTILDGGSVRAGFRIGATDYSSEITVTISNLTVQNGRAYDGAGGAYIFGRLGMTVNMTDVTVKDSTAGGGIYQDEASNGHPTGNYTRVTATNNDIRPNTGRGGGMIAYGIATLTNCVLSNNHVRSEGAGLALVTGATVTMTGGSITGNTAHEYAPGTYGNGAGFLLYSGASTFTATNVTMTNNTAEGIGGLGFVSAVGSTVSLTGCTISGNTAGVLCDCVFQAWNASCNSSYCV